MSVCVECQARTVWDDQVGSEICTACGTLLDPSQSVLASHLEPTDTSARQYTLPFWSQPSSIHKSLRSKNGWKLAGQGKQARYARNMAAMQDLIRSLAASLSSSSLVPRALNLFSQAMSKGRYRWGRKGRLIAAAAFAIALRESGRPDSVRDISLLLGERSSTPLSRAFTEVYSLLGLPQLSLAGPAQHFPVLKSHLRQLLDSQSASQLPKELISLISSLSFASAQHTATSLSVLLSRLGEAFPLNSLPTAPTACALLILAFEAELRASFPHLSTLATALGARFDAGKGVVLARYKVLYDLVEEWIREVPWLERFDVKGKGKAKMAKRTVVARGLKDVVQFQEEIWRKKLDTHQGPQIDSEADTDEEESEIEVVGRIGPPSKKRRLTSSTMDEASRFLLNPLSNPTPSLHKTPTHSPQTPPDGPERRLCEDSLPPMTTYLLASTPLSLRTPTRLQLLCAARGGSEAEVKDEELFGEGELQSMMRSTEEVEEMRQAGLFEWADTETEGAKTSKDERQRPGVGRVDMAALARILNGECTFNAPDHDVDLDASNDLEGTS